MTKPRVGFIEPVIVRLLPDGPDVTTGSFKFEGSLSTVAGGEFCAVTRTFTWEITAQGVGIG